MKLILLLQVSVLCGMGRPCATVVLAPGIEVSEGDGGTITPDEARRLKRDECRLCCNCVKGTGCAAGCAGLAALSYAYEENAGTFLGTIMGCLGLYWAQLNCGRCYSVHCYRCKKQVCCKVKEHSD